MSLSIEFPSSMNFLLTESSRYKVLYGGRGAGKSENVSVALLILSLSKKLRIACFREFQSSMKESVHALIQQKIYDLKIDSLFDITDTSINCLKTGSEFLFKGLRHNIDSIKSMARIDIGWVEEARNVSRTSWTKLGPTIRGRHESDPNGMGGPFGKGPEIWVTFNPELDTDETYVRFIKNPPSEYDSRGERYCIVKKVNWSDNKWFPPDLREEMEEDKKKNKDKWLEVWEGNTKQVLEGAVYANEIRETLLAKRRGKVPYDPSKPVFTCWDLGHKDKTAIWFVQRVGMEYNLIHYYENSLQKLNHYLEYMQKLGYIYSTCYMPHDADNETLAARSIAVQTRAAGFKVIVVNRPAKKVLGINAARTVFPLCNFDEENTADGWQCLMNYAYKTYESSKSRKWASFSNEPDHDTPWSHGADGFQTFALSLRTEQDVKKPKERTVGSGKVLSIQRGIGWMG